MERLAIEHCWNTTRVVQLVFLGLAHVIDRMCSLVARMLSVEMGKKEMMLVVNGG